ncbi:hypothetical protein KHP62_03910 [Rhodobacteraceae bacterium NNCM2]|nr:hypothetical protein [Coraliihabitans acroporae]
MPLILSVSIISIIAGIATALFIIGLLILGLGVWLLRDGLRNKAAGEQLQAAISASQGAPMERATT